MKSQFQMFHGGTFQMRWGQPMRLDSANGELGVLDGRVWLTRRGDLDDHVLDAGQRIVLTPDDSVVVEQWNRGEPAIVDWQPRAQPLRWVWVLRGVVARVLREAEAGFTALARTAAAMAKRAQGCI